MKDVPPGQALGHHLEGAQHDAGLPVALAAEAEAVGHQPLHGQARQLAQPAEVLEVGRECREAAIGEERAHADLDAGAVAQRVVPVASRAAGRPRRRRCRRTPRTSVSISASATSSTTATRSLTPQVLTETPKRRSASTLSPSVTATLRMLSPNRASRIVAMARRGRRPPAPRLRPGGRPPGRRRGRRRSCATTPIRVCTAANSRSPWAAWLRFMKSMSISAHGSAWLAWVCRCSSGLRSWSRPVIHIFAGLKVCIQAMTPTQSSSALGVDQGPADRSGVGEHRRGDHPHRHVVGGVRAPARSRRR